MPTYRVQDNASGKTVEFEWHGTDEPTDADMESVFAEARGGTDTPDTPDPSAGDSWSDLPGNILPSVGRLIGGAVSGVAGPNWVLAGDAAGCVNPLNGEGIDYGLETGRLAAELFAAGGGLGADISAEWVQVLTRRYGPAFSGARRLAGLLTRPELLLRADAQLVQHNQFFGDSDTIRFLRPAHFVQSVSLSIRSCQTKTFCRPQARIEPRLLFCQRAIGAFARTLDVPHGAAQGRIPFSFRFTQHAADGEDAKNHRGDREGKARDPVSGEGNSGEMLVQDQLAPHHHRKRQREKKHSPPSLD